jgi:hypothetical protein
MVKMTNVLEFPKKRVVSQKSKEWLISNYSKSKKKNYYLENIQAVLEIRRIINEKHF